jgi:hypothetical protein
LPYACLPVVCVGGSLVPCREAWACVLCLAESHPLGATHFWWTESLVLLQAPSVHTLLCQRRRQHINWLMSCMCAVTRGVLFVSGVCVVAAAVAWHNRAQLRGTRLSRAKFSL